MKIVSFSLEQGNKYFGKIDGDRFFIGSRVSFQGLKGLMNTTGTAAQKYDRNAFRAAHDRPRADEGPPAGRRGRRRLLA